MIALIKDLGELAASGARGAALAEAAALVDPRHLGLILGLYNIYCILTSIGYFPKDEQMVHWPPHEGKPDFDSAAWAASGSLGDEAAKLLNLLTFTAASKYYMDIFEPDSAAWCYIGKPDKWVRDPLYQYDEKQMLPLRYLLISRATSTSRVLVYDTLDAKIGWWDIPKKEWTGPEAVQLLEWQSPSEVLNGIAQRIIDLDILPWHISVDDPALDTEPAKHFSTPETNPPDYWYINVMNKFIAKQQIFRRHGWPGPDYQADAAWDEMHSFDDRCKELEEKLPKSEYRHDMHADVGREYSQFLNAAAGSRAVNRPSFEQCSDPFCFDCEPIFFYSEPWKRAVSNETIQ